MTRETKPAYPINAKSPCSKDDPTFEQFGKKNSADSKASGASEKANSAFISDKATLLNGREREGHSQREAVIRPQQAGKIDFKSLHNRPKFSSDASWTNGKSSPLSPGKSRGKDKNKKSGKGDRNQHQLYRLSISSSRSNPTIGIAYPQQKVTPPKKVELSQGPISGSYRFNVSSLPDREGEVHQEDRNFNRSHPEPSPSLTSTSYTSQTAPASRINQGLKILPGNLHDTANSSGQLHYLEFQPNGNTWHPSDKHFTGTGEYVISNQKLCPFTEGNKSDYVPGSFPYPFPSLQEQVGNTFCNNGSNQDFVDAAMAANQLVHSTYSFQSSSREGQEDSQDSGSYNTVLPDNRTYGIPSQQPPFLHTQQGVQHSPTPLCYTGHNDHVSDHNGAISSTGAFSSSGAIEQTQSTFQENQSVFNSSEFSLHNNSMPTLINKRQQPSKDFVHNQRLLTPGSTLRRNIPQTSLSKVHFPGKVFSSVNTGSVPFDKNLSRIPQIWDAGNNFTPLDQNSVSYPNTSGNVIPYQYQPNEQRQVLKNQRMSWQQSLNTPSATNQNRIELSRHIGNHKPFPLSNADWQNLTKIPPSYHTKNTVVEGSPTQRANMSRQNYSSNNEILYDNAKDTNDTRIKSISYGISQPIQQSQNNSNQPLPLSGKSFVPESPYESPLPSPVTNPVSGSTCSSLSPMSSSPVNPDENQVPHILTSSPYFHQPCYPAEKPFNMSDSFLYSNTEPTKTYNYIPEPSKEEHAFKNLQENQYQKIASEPSKGCLENFQSEPPPPYSSHHFLASSLSSANLDQLDVLLTCKQCDQNFGNLSSFLDHRQYCSLNSTIQTEMKDSLNGGDIRKSSVDQLKCSQILPGISLHKPQILFNSHVTGFSKDYLLDSNTKADAKEDSLKSNTLLNATPHLLPLTACDTLEMDDAKLDSLIIEALNGLEFQVDNPDIDSTFIDVFVDDDLTSAKACNNSQKVKDNKVTKKCLNVEQKLSHHNSVSCTLQEKCDTDESQLQKNVIKMGNDKKCTEKGSVQKYSVDTNLTKSKNITKTNLEDCEWQKSESNNIGTSLQEKKETTLNKTDFECIDGRHIKPYESQQERIVKNDPQDLALTETSKSRKASFKDTKKKKAHNGTWSKELIHKIVQQKNKLHKLHVKSNKNVQFSLVTERIFPPAKTHPFGEYDYISDSDDDLATSLPENSRMKYNFNQGRGTRTKVKEPIWRMGEATRFQLQSKDLRNTNKETTNRIRRRNSQSSNSSDQSTSISSETGSSPKSTERTDSENEQECVPRCKSFSTQSQKNAERNLIKPLLRENSPESIVHTDFTKGTKRFGSAKFLLASSKVYQKSNETHYNENVKLQQTTDSSKKNMSKTHGIQGLKNGEDDKQSTYQEAMAASTLSQNDYDSKLMVNIDAPPQQHSYNLTNTNYQEKQLNSIPGEINPAFCDDSVKYLNEEICNDSQDFSISVPCYNEDSSISILPQQKDKSYGGECQQYPSNKDVHPLYRNNSVSTDIKQIYTNQNMHSFENKCSELGSYPSDNNENKVSADLSFDSSSLFAELPIADFETPLYNNTTSAKDNYVELNQSGKSSNFEQQFPEFLQEKSWDLIDGISLSTDNVPPFHVQENQTTEKYVENMPVSSEQIPSLSDYNVAFINNISEDELEIKRLVTELESQLQTSKVYNDTSTKTLPKDQIHQELTDSTLTLTEMTANPKHATPQLQDSQPLVKVDRSCENLRNSWTCSVQLDSVTSDIQCHRQTSILNDACMTEGLGSLGNNHSLSADMSEKCLSNLTSHKKCPKYPDHDHLKEILVQDEDQLSENNKNKDIHEKESQQNDTKNLSVKEQHAEEQYDDPPKLEPVRSMTETDTVFVLRDVMLNTADTPVHKNGEPEESLCDQQLLSTSSETEYNKKNFILHKEGLQDNDNPKDFVLLDMPILVKEENAISEKSMVSKESTENPLQQLQLFVARTAKNNEEDMRIPCFPILLATSSVSDSKTEADSPVLCTAENTLTSIDESEKNSKEVEQNEVLQLSECCTQQVDIEHAGSKCCTFFESFCNKAQCKDKQANSTECIEQSILDIGTVGLRNDPESLQSKIFSEVQVEKNGNVRCFGEIDGKKFTSPMKKGKPPSTSSEFDIGAYTGSGITSTSIVVQEHSSDVLEADSLENGTLEMKPSQTTKINYIKTQDQSSDVSVFGTPENNQQPMDILQKTELLNNQQSMDVLQETSLLSEDKGDPPATGNKSSTHIPLPPNTNEVLCNNMNDYETHLLSIPTAHSVLSFDLLSTSLKESFAPQKLLYTSADNELDEVESHSLCKNNETCQNEQELAKHLEEEMDIQIYRHKDNILTLDNSQKLSEEKVLLEPVVEGSITPCFCSELVCAHYKGPQQEPLANIILGCQSIPTNNTYPIYTGENTNYLTLQNEIFPETIQTPVNPSIQEQTNKCDWNDGSNMELVFPNKEDRSSAIACDLIGIADQGFVDFVEKATEKTVGQIATGLHNTDVEKKISIDEPDSRCTSDMHSVIDGVLRILEGDKSKEILQSIGISPKSSPVKEKKSAGLSLTCNICSVSFRSKPGLTRHKAIKHNGSLASQKDGVISAKLLNVKNVAYEWNANNDSQHNLDTTSQNIIADLLNPDSNLQPQILIPNEEQRPLSAKNSEDTVICDSVSKNKLNGKVKKRKRKSSNKSTDSQIPPDDVLNILKTNILKAIGQSNSFTSSEISLGQSLNKDMEHTEISSKNKSLETYSNAVTIDDDEKLVSDVLDMQMNGESLLQEQTWAKNPNSHNEQFINDCKIQPVETMLVNDQGLIDERKDHSVGADQVQKEVEVSNTLKETVPDFHMFFDDDNTFSQLFPKDDHFIRRKCTRVYGKRNKRHTPPFESDFKHIDIAEQCHTPQINYSSDYRNISLESTLKSSHFSNPNEHLAHYEPLSPSKETSEDDESKILSFVCQNQKNMNVPLLTDRIENEKDRDLSPHITLYKPSAETSDLSVEMSPDIRDLQTEDILGCNASDEIGLPEVPTIDMKMLSKKFDMRELSFFSACGDDSDQSDIEISDINQTPEKRKKNNKNKVSDKKQPRNHTNTKMKSKDKQYKCKVCFQWFLTLGELDFHKLTHNPSPPPTCYMCVQRKFSSREQLRDHLKEKHAKNKAGLWICGMCLKEISDVWMYNEHLREHATQFARKGQAQKSVMGIPGCFGGDSMVRTFLSTFIYRTPSALSKISEADDKGVLNKRQDQKEHKGEEEVIGEKEPENIINVVPPAPIQQVKLSVSPSIDNSQKSDAISKNAAMHPHCKDPSRDCHHCGKQFPKPFKLQRHLVVHSLQKMYLCHICPKSYQEAQELRSHLNSEHQLAEKSEIKHTTLYACELCADVMHVIKKSFICSTCNYTFSKKEQYDRHMEKHLIGGSMTFKFRGVTRPTISGKELKHKIKESPIYNDIPPPKKSKTSTYSHTCADVEAIDNTDLSECPKLSPGVIFDEMIDENNEKEHESTVKMEEIPMDAPELQAEGMKEQLKGITEECPESPKICDLKIGKKEHYGITNDTVATIESSVCTEENFAPHERNTEYTDTKDKPTDGYPGGKLGEPTEIQTSQTKVDNGLTNLLTEEPDNLFTSVKTVPPSIDTHGELQLLLHKDVEVDKAETNENKTIVSLSPSKNSLMTENDTVLKGLKKNKSSIHPTEKSGTEYPSEELLKIFTPKVKQDCSVSRDMKETNTSQTKIAKKDLTVNFSKNNTDFKMLDKLSGALCQKLQQRKRKEQKLSVNKSNAASQENLAEVKKKKNKTVMTVKTESSVNVKKSEWISGFLDAKDETPGTRPHLKPHTGGIGSQFKKPVLDAHNQKKLNAQSVNGEYRNKRTTVTKSNHQFSPKSSALSSNSTSYKRKMGHNTKPTEPSNYRTAESQNNLLSQLFGQKLTSFKIPLRRDVTE
ncbi:zinc finger protein 469 [Hyla sarda]|uniref:zinc finger protein 469 n=1 Tax=Hyla sarda TaxID=327740 RepID=UPI0024C27F0C|nr:zinc finger protein 469 [Hyla sarda]XP_056381531.1 zinc finger protein 469 [Hyla sarda]XP_056381533.1 zinc finger protein 469 [Hyla sarda]XP_056381534.1 zinc finger protein 469 [Hyla sarda]XP_056381535.1 zinc finger protein 469 [Hyla sarda]XP_056381536.1 zinc finger protein 469 [Hyla sarda]XP_056381537.1 zinc finger protein 469 [Hyla sarda]XP_056381538.1 zinc finger protein 469 [Hyla sarda]XP_056381539.1 zinc finger protein 469 [Hyla sarda]XP_056381540.1 zinc finger protein 469 [Hyla sa